MNGNEVNQSRSYETNKWRSHLAWPKCSTTCNGCCQSFFCLSIEFQYCDFTPRKGCAKHNILIRVKGLNVQAQPTSAEVTVAAPTTQGACTGHSRRLGTTDQNTIHVEQGKFGHIHDRSEMLSKRVGKKLKLIPCFKKKLRHELRNLNTIIVIQILAQVTVSGSPLEMVSKF